MELLLATRNIHKIRELRLLLKPLVPGFDIVSLLNFPDYVPPPEEGASFEENAACKAIHAASTLKCWALSDDSGLVVPALRGEPGIFSRRYAGLKASDADNRTKLLASMKELQGLERAAYFTCALALANPQGLHKACTGLCEGYIAAEERGRHGFGYDSLFIKHDYDKSFAELDEHTKNCISHRYKALEKFASVLQTLQL